MKRCAGVGDCRCGGVSDGWGVDWFELPLPASDDTGDAMDSSRALEIGDDFSPALEATNLKRSSDPNAASLPPLEMLTDALATSSLLLLVSGGLDDDEVGGGDMMAPVNATVPDAPAASTSLLEAASGDNARRLEAGGTVGDACDS